MFEIKSTRKLEQYWLSPQRRSLESYKSRKRKKKIHSVCVRDHGDLYNTWSLNQSTDRNVDIKSSVGSFSIIGFNTRKIESSEAIKSLWLESYRQSISMCGNWFTVTSPYGKPFVLTEPHINTLIQRVLNFTAPYERCVLASGNARQQQELLSSAYQVQSFNQHQVGVSREFRTIAFVKIAGGAQCNSKNCYRPHINQIF